MIKETITVAIAPGVVMIRIGRLKARTELQPRSHYLTTQFEEKVETWVKETAKELGNEPITRTFLLISLFKVWNKVGDYKCQVSFIPKLLRVPEYLTPTEHYIQFRSGCLIGQPLLIVN